MGEKWGIWGSDKLIYCGGKGIFLGMLGRAILGFGVGKVALGEGFIAQGLAPCRSSSFLGADIVGGPSRLRLRVLRVRIMVMLMLRLMRLLFMMLGLVVVVVVVINVITRARVCGIVEVGAGAGAGERALNRGSQALQDGGRGGGARSEERRVGKECRN